VLEVIFPHFTKISIKWNNIQSGHSVLWNVCSQLKSSFCPDVGALTLEDLVGLRHQFVPRLARSVPKIPSQQIAIMLGIYESVYMSVGPSAQRIVKCKLEDLPGENDPKE